MKRYDYRWLAVPLAGNEEVPDKLRTCPGFPYTVRVTEDAIEIPVVDLAEPTLEKGPDGCLHVIVQHASPLLGTIRVASFNVAHAYRAVKLLSDLTDLIRSTLEESPRELWRPDTDYGRLVGTRYEPGWTLELSTVPRPSQHAALAEEVSP